MKKLVGLGLVERWSPKEGVGKGANLYKLTADGVRLLDQAYRRKK